MFVYRSVIPATRQLRTLAGAFYQNSKTYSFYAKEPYKQKQFSLDKKSMLLPGPEKIRASLLADDPSKIIGHIPGSPEIQTVFEVLEHGLKVSNDGPCIGNKVPETGEYRWQSYSEVISRIQHVGSGLIQLGLKPNNDTSIGIFATNCEEFLLSLYACSGYSMVLVPFYMTLGLPAVLYLVNHAKLPVVITVANQHASLILNNAATLPTVKTLVMCEQPTSEHLKMAEAANIRILTFSEMEEMGKLNKKEFVIPHRDDLFCIPFTSGTTGIPKGVMVTHKNIIACLSSVVFGYGDVGVFGGTIISYLPPAHMYEIFNQVSCLYFARRIAFYRGEIQNLMEEVKYLKPTILPLVPRMMNNIYMEAMKKIKESKLKSALLPMALRQKEKLLKRGKVTKNTIWDKYVFKDFQDSLGGNTHMISTAAAAVDIDVMRFYRCASGCYVFEAYGCTETLAAVMTFPREPTAGHVGGPMPCNHIKLVDVPEMEYFSKDDTGEICMKGDSIFKGYLNNPEATNELLKDGWFHSGDIGKFLPNGALQIIDRKKHLFKLSQGIYIAPEKIENVYSFSNLILQILIDGIPGKDYIIALVVPHPITFKQWLASKGYTDSEKLSEILMRKDVRRDFLLELHKEGKERHLNSLEQARNMAFLSVPFTIDNDMLTPTLKMKRNVARKHYEQLFHKLYEEGPLIDSLTL